LNTLFLDSFVYSHIARDSDFAAQVRQFIEKQDYVLAVSIVNLIEFLPHRKRLEAILDFIVSVPFAIARNVDEIVDDEIRNYPQSISLPTGFVSTQASFSRDELCTALHENLVLKVSFFRDRFVPAAKRAFEQIIATRDSGKAAFSGARERDLFLLSNLMAFLFHNHVDFLTAHAESEIQIKKFKVYYIQLLVIFEEYYRQKKVGTESDIGDLLQLGYAPYVDLAVFDNAKVDCLQRLDRGNLLPWLVNYFSMQKLREMIKKSSKNID